MFGPIASPLRRGFVLGLAILVGTVVAVVMPKVFVCPADTPKVCAAGTPDAWTTPVTIVFGVLAALAVLLDRIADAYDKRDADRIYRSSESTAEASVSELNSMLLEAIESTFTERTARDTSIEGLRRNLVRFAANAVGPGSRATYYTLLSSVPGNRVLGDAKHATTVGRQDTPERPWVENQNPGHAMWRLLDVPDQHQVAHSRPEDVGDTEWDAVAYDTFLTIPVKAHGIVFGVLSVNNATAGAIGDAQRAVIISMARTMALTLAFDAGAGAMKSRDASGGLSLAGVRLFENEGTDGSHDRAAGER